MKELTAEDILKADDRKIIPFTVEEWGGTVFIRVVSGEERDRFEGECIKDKSNFRARLACLALCDKSGAALFPQKDYLKLSSKGSAALDKVFDKICEINHIGPGEKIEGLAKN